MSARSVPAGSPPHVSVIIPTRNRRRMMARALASVLAQEDVHLEAIVVDEASEDGTADYLRGLGDDRLAVIRHPAPVGVAAARNAGIERARGAWLAFVDDDDLWAPDKLARQLDALSASGGSKWSCAGAVVLDEELRILDAEHPPASADALPALLHYNTIPGGGSGVVAAAELVRSAGGFDRRLRVLADWDLWIRLARRSPLTAVDRPLVGYVRHGESMSRDLGRLVEELALVEAKHGPALAERGLEFDWDRWLVWAAAMHRRAGRRWYPAAIYARLARRRRSPADLVRAGLSAAWPGWMRLREQRRARAVPPEWRENAERWVAAFREAEA